MLVKSKKQCTFARSRAINKLFHIGRYIRRFIGQYRAIYRPIFQISAFFATNDMANDFPIPYRQQAKKEISDDISADSADI